MGHSVKGHLKLNVADYDKLIRQLVPGYAAMREAHMALLRKLLPADRRCLVLDLGGITEAQARAHFASWAHEDYYPPLAAELRLVGAAGFAAPECFWREIPFLIFGGMK